MISTYGWTVLGCGALLGLHPMFRARLTHKTVGRLLRIADSMWKQAVEQGKADHEHVIGFHDSVIELAMHAPLISTGLIVVPTRIVQDSSKRDELSEFLDANAWMKPFVAASHCCLKVLAFLGSPWKVGTLPYACTCAIALRFRSEADGGLSQAPRSSETSQQVEAIYRSSKRVSRAGELVSC